MRKQKCPEAVERGNKISEKEQSDGALYSLFIYVNATFKDGCLPSMSSGDNQLDLSLKILWRTRKSQRLESFSAAAAGY